MHTLVTIVRHADAPEFVAKGSDRTTIHWTPDPAQALRTNAVAFATRMAKLYGAEVRVVRDGATKPERRSLGQVIALRPAVCQDVLTLLHGAWEQRDVDGHARAMRVLVRRAGGQLT